MSVFFDTANNPLSSLNLSQQESSAQTFVLRIKARTGFYLTTNRESIGIPQAQIVSLFARLASSNDAWQNLTISPFDLSHYAGQTVEIEFRLETGASEDIKNVALPIRYTSQV